MNISEWFITLVATGIIPFLSLIVIIVFELINKIPVEPKKKGSSKR